MKNKKRIIFIVSAAALVFAIILGVSAVSLRARSEREDTETEVGFARRSERCSFLLLGQDRASSLTDVMMLVSVDSDGKTASVIQIPRDTYAKYGDGSHRKLNSALSSLGGAEELCSFLSGAMGVQIDGYILFDLDAFVKVVDAVGGVEIDLPFDMEYYDPYQDLTIDLKAGRQTLDGASAEKFIRYRSGYLRGDLGRIDAQKLFLSAFIKKVSESMTPATLVKLAISVLGDIKTDLSIIRITELASAVMDIELEKVTMVTLAGCDIRSGRTGAWFYILSRPSAARTLAEYAGAPEGSFDMGGAFTDTSNDEFMKIYNSDIPAAPSSAKDIEENGIDIQKR